MVWNVQGTGNKRKINAIKEVVRTYKPTVLALVKTHMAEEHAIKMGSILGYAGQSRVNAIGFSGGIWLYWKKDVVTVTPIAEHQQFITVEISRNGELHWFFSAMYANPDPANMRELWVELENFARRNNRPWLLAAFTGPSHTWARGHSVETRQSARLDRALCNADWGALFENAMVRNIPAIQSDHCPLFISPNGFVPLNAINRPFGFQACWLTHENVKEFVDNSWPEEGIFTSHLGTLSKKLQNWNAEVFGDIFKQKKSLMARIEGCQCSLSLSRKTNIIKLEANLRGELDEVLAREELL
ncbi:uncharacterized protein LOC141641491 [Silene latifolia]|uniref:uncharacterized protein LOC141641491 n=1 Tax=Silene latifolia TaxID=37657 RepID=UPI003D7757BC